MRFIILLFAVMATVMANDSDEALQRQLQAGNDVFTSKMFAEVTKQKPGKSVVLSAFSVLQPLAQLSLAAVGESHDELLQTIGLPNDNVTRAVFPLVNGNLRAVKGVDIKTASKVYIPVGFELDDTFAADSKSVFGSEVKNIDFTKNVDAAKEINTWVEEQTNNKIKDLVSSDSLNALTRAVLVNAIYFKGSWKTKFDSKLTTDRDFHVTNEVVKKIPTMFKKAEYKYAESKDLDAKLLELPYEGEETSFLVVLPNKVDGLPALLEKLKDPSALPKAVSNMYPVEVEVYLPKFKIETTTNLKEVLQAIGLNKIFNEGEARLDHLLKTKESLYVSEAIQKAFIEVNEEGAEAAAANEFSTRTRTLFIRIIQYIFRADRPFYYQLNIRSGPVLFSGIFDQST